MEEAQSQNLLLNTNFNEKNYSTFPLKERNSNSTSDGNERNENGLIPQIGITQKKQDKIKKSLKMAQMLNTASSYWVQVCNNNNQ